MREVVLTRSKHLQRIICAILFLSFCIAIFSGCDKIFNFNTEDEPEEEITEEMSDEERFDVMIDDLFAEWVSEDTLTMNYFLANPEAMGIERPEGTYGEVMTPEDIAHEKELTQEMAEQLGSFDYDLLRKDQQIIYDILDRSLRLSKVMEREDDFFFYTGYIRPLTGIQVQLPVLLAEFSFYTAADIERYLDMIEDTVRYFDDLIEYERERSRRGFFMSEANVDSVIEQVESYLKNREDNLLITVFNDRVDNYEGLSAEQRAEYKQRNRELVLNNVLKAYENLLAAFKELRGVGAHDGGIASLPGGRDYAHATLCLKVGTDRSADELYALLDEWMDMTYNSIMATLSTNQKLYDKYINSQLGKIEAGTPKSIISKLQKAIVDDFPQIASTRHVVLEIHENLQEHMSPAFYLTPAVDSFDDNVIYVNPSKLDNDLFLFTVLAHESYPGHLYQTVYFRQQSPHPIRTLISNMGYTEGWATYVEMLSYGMAGLSDEEAMLVWNIDRFYDMLLSSQIDLGVNLLGWDIDKVAERLGELGINSMEVANSIYDMVTGVPLHTVTYALGFIELNELLTDAQDAMGDDFDLTEFHRFILDMGPAPFPLIKARMDSWMSAADTQEEAEAEELEPAA